ncbi:MAG: homoserine O-acetyltransferase [Hadesarchaea archaeon DG-33-1]|nr:MAG: homoserine O-acetyltransferase [Hadesarchaea archaeon DG-33-1]
MQEGSIGRVNTRYYTLPGKLKLEGGKKFGPVTLAYETYGDLNKERSNAILICHALSGDAHVAGWHEGDRKPGWWDGVVGPGKTFDTERYFVICSNVLGGCKGSTGPSSINPATGKPYGLEFPIITVSDMVNAQKKLIDHLGIKQLLAVVGGSLGGMQVLQWTISYPDMVRFAIPIATAARSSPLQIAFNEVRRRAVMADPKWNNGDYYGRELPRAGLALARMIGHITFLSDESMYQKFGRRLQNKEKYGFDFSTDFKVESYLHYKGNSFVKRFDANSYIYITRAIDYFDLTNGGHRSLKESFENVKARFLVISISSDWIYPPYQSKEIAMALSANDVDINYSEINSNYGHDAFLVELGQMTYVITNFLSHTSVKDVMLAEVPKIKRNTTIETAARIMIEQKSTHLPVVSENGKLMGIVTAWDISKAVALKYRTLDEIMTRDVITADLNESINSVAKKIEKYNISALPVINEKGEIIGIVTSDSISRLIAGSGPLSGTETENISVGTVSFI